MNRGQDETIKLQNLRPVPSENNLGPEALQVITIPPSPFKLLERYIYRYKWTPMDTTRGNTASGIPYYPSELF